MYSDTFVKYNYMTFRGQQKCSPLNCEYETQCCILCSLGIFSQTTRPRSSNNQSLVLLSTTEPNRGASCLTFFPAAYSQYALFSIPFAARNYFPQLLKSQVGSFSRGLKIACLYKRNSSGRVTLLHGTELRPVSFNKRQQNSIFPETFLVRACCPNIKKLGNIVSSVSFCFQDANYANDTRQGILTKI